MDIEIKEGCEATYYDKKVIYRINGERIESSRHHTDGERWWFDGSRDTFQSFEDSLAFEKKQVEEILLPRLGISPRHDA